MEELTANDSNTNTENKWTKTILAVSWKTPKKARDIQIQALIATQLGDLDISTHRYIFRKMAKGFNIKDFDLAQAKVQIEQLEAKVEEL